MDSVKRKPVTSIDPKIKAIIEKVEAHGLIRHINGNTLDNRRANLQRVTVLQAFKHKDWTVDAICILTEEEFGIWSRVRAEWKQVIIPAPKFDVSRNRHY